MLSKGVGQISLDCIDYAQPPAVASFRTTSVSASARTLVKEQAAALVLTTYSRCVYSLWGIPADADINSLGTSLSTSPDDM